MPKKPPSYLGGMTSKERVIAAVLALQAHMPLRVITAGGYEQFMRIARPQFRNYGLTNKDLERAWQIIQYRVGIEVQCEREAEAAQRRAARKATVH